MTSGRKSQLERHAGNLDHKGCDAIKAISKVGNELRLFVIRYLLDKPMRFNELLDAAKTVDPKSLSRVLKYLAAEGIVRREVLGTQPFKVQYSLTEKGMELRPVIDALHLWGDRWLVAPEAITKNSSR